MPDQVPSALWDSVNSSDSIFALELDTKQRFDNILSGVQKPIDYPIPEFDKQLHPDGLPQNDLLNPNITRGTIGEALFSPDPRVSAYANDKLRANQSRLPIAQGVGVPDRFQYDKMMDKYIKGDFGYNPYQSIEDNEDFNYRYDYLNQSLFERITKNIGTGLSRFVGSVVLKLGQTAGYLGSMIGNGIEEIFNAKDNNFMADVADNSLSRWFEGVEEDMKNTQLLSVFKPRNWEDRGFFNKLGHGAFWTDEVADGAAFMGEMVASMYLLGGLGKIGALGRLGATEINLASRLGGTGKAIDTILKTATGAQNISGIGRWAFATTSEAAFEASGLYKQRKEQLKREREAGVNDYSDAEIERISGDSAAGAFKANMLILSASNAFENRFIFSPLFDRLGKSANPRSGLIDISNSTGKLDDVLKASRKEYDYSTWVGKKLDWKNSNSRLRFYGSRGLSATAMEGFWEENAQLAAERLASTDNLSTSSFLRKILSQTGKALSGDDPEAATSIGLGAIIGVGGTGAVGKLRGGDRLFQGERRKKEADTLSAIDVYNEYRMKFLNFQDIYETDADGKPIMDSEGNMQINETKALGLLEGLNKFASKQAAIEKIYDPLLRKNLQDDAINDFVFAAKSAGVYDKALKKFLNVEALDQEQLMNLGFDPNTTVDVASMKESIKKMGELYEETMSAPAAKMGKEDTIADERNRKVNLYKAKGREYTAKKLSNEYRTRLSEGDYPSAFSPEAEDQDTNLQEYNSLVYRKRRLEQFKGLAAENTDFYNPFIEQEDKLIKEQSSRLLKSLFVKIRDGKLVPTFEGFLMSNARFEKLFGRESAGYFNVKPVYLQEYNPEALTGVDGKPPEPQAYFTLEDLGYSEEKFKRAAGNEANRRQAGALFDMESSAQAKYAELESVGNQQAYLSDKLANPETGIKNYKEYKAWSDSIQSKDEQADPQETETPPVPETPQVTPVAGPSTPVATETAPEAKPEVEKPTRQDILNNSEMLAQLNSLFVSAYSRFINTDEGAEPEVPTDLIDFINNNYDTNSKEIDFFLNREIVEKLLQPLADKITSKTLDPDNEEDANMMGFFENTDNFVSHLAANGLNDELVLWLNESIGNVADALENYDPSAKATPVPPVETPPVETPPVDETPTEETTPPVEEGTTEPPPPPVEPPVEDATPEPEGETQADESRETRSENTPPPVPPQLPPPPPLAPENSDMQAAESENMLDVYVDESKKNGLFTFIQNFPEEVQSDRKGNPVITDGTIQMKTTSSDQAEQLLRQHNVLRRMSMKNEPINFWTETQDGQPMFRIKLVHAGIKNAAQYAPWTYNTAKGKVNPRTGKEYDFPFIIAVITDTQGQPVYFTQQGEITDKASGLPVAFPYSAEEYLSGNIGISRRGVITKTREPLNGHADYLNSDPLADVSSAVLRGIPIFATIEEVTSGKLSSANATNSPSVEMRDEYKLRSVKEIQDSGDVSNGAPIVLQAGNFFEYAADIDGKQQQRIKVGQPLLFDNKTGLYIPLRGKKIKDVTLNGKPLMTGGLLKVMEALEQDGKIELGDNYTDEQKANFDSLFVFLRSLFYSKNVVISRNQEGNIIYYRDARPVKTPLMESELNYTMNISILLEPISGVEFAYEDFAAENFMTGALPAQVSKGERRFEKVNKRIVFTLDKGHQEILEALGAKPDKKPVRVTDDDMNKFVNKTYRRKGGKTTVKVTAYKDGKFTIVDENGDTVEQTKDDFMKSLKSMEEVILPVASEETKEEFVERKKLSKEEIKEQIEKSKTSSTDDLKKDIDLGCE